ncbi:hypothetical protein GX48_01562 [Paracoccidioides brasiliensis]|nr:hypothetical protein GX48_01562 [Paracoccidioides brasiliensis]
MRSSWFDNVLGIVISPSPHIIQVAFLELSSALEYNQLVTFDAVARPLKVEHYNDRNPKCSLRDRGLPAIRDLPSGCVAEALRFAASIGRDFHGKIPAADLHQEHVLTDDDDLVSGTPEHLTNPRQQIGRCNELCGVWAPISHNFFFQVGFWGVLPSGESNGGSIIMGKSNPQFTAIGTAQVSNNFYGDKS